MLLQFKEFVASDALQSRFDICIAGGGVAGITLARQLGKLGKRVLLLEGGDVDFTAESQELYQGSNIGREYFELDVPRLRHLGGTSNHWAGFCRPLDAFDFEKRDDIPHSGWPISKDDLSPWLEPATEIMEVNNPFPEDQAVDHSDDNLRKITIQLSPPVRFGEKYLQELKDSEQIWTVVNANVVDIRLNEGLGQVESLTVTGQNSDDQRIDVEASVFILALGGIENARTLLNANSQIERGVGNANDLVGRYFMEHFELDVGHVLLDAPMPELFPDLWEDDRIGRAVPFAVTRPFIHQKGTLNCELRLFELSEWREPSFVDSLKKRVRQMLCSSDTVVDLATYIDDSFKQTKCMLIHHTAGAGIDEFDAFVQVTAEQAPNPDSRVLLSDDRDRLGLRKVALDWRTLDVDKATLKESIIELGRTFATANIGRIRVAEWLLDDQAEIAGFPEGERGAGFHHIGTTRMGHSPKDGVVDKDGKVFGMDNLYIAGSSVFTTGGHVPPTFTIVQLALRLANHLDTKLS